MSYKQILDLRQFFSHTTEVWGVVSNSELFIGDTIQQVGHIAKHLIVFMVHVIVDFLNVFIIEFQEQESYVIYVWVIDGLYEFSTNGGQ